LSESLEIKGAPSSSQTNRRLQAAVTVRAGGDEELGLSSRCGQVFDVESGLAVGCLVVSMQECVSKL
jgi:hypothetical protein